MVEGKRILAIPPGETIKEQLEDRGMTQKEFAMRMEMSEKHISKLINGEVLLTLDVAMRLENVLGISSSFWMNMENIYREKLKRIEDEKADEDEAKLVDKFPYAEMASFGWVNKTKEKSEKVKNLRNFFEVNRLPLVFEKEQLNILYRCVCETDKSDCIRLVLAQKANLESRQVETSSIQLGQLKKHINDFRSMTREDPSVFFKRLQKELAQDGVALILLPSLSGSYLHGITFIAGNKIVLGLTARGKDAEGFWLSFFHEIGHILLGHIQKEYVESMEKEADAFARDALIPPKQYQDFLSRKTITRKTINDFSRQIGIAPGIVVGRLQKDGVIPYSRFNEMKEKYTISNEGSK